MERVKMDLPRLYAGSLVERPNRFLALVKLQGGEVVRAFVADPGRLTELLYPGVGVFLAYAAKEGRSTDYDLALVESGDCLVSVDSRVPNKLIAKALECGAIKHFEKYCLVKSEPVVEKGRLDFKLTGEGLPDCYIEVKSCTLVRDGEALFPDAPTSRGAKHLGELRSLKSRDNRAVVLFVIQHPGGFKFSPNVETDPLFAAELALAYKAGVEVYAYRCAITFNQILLTEEVPVNIISSK